jgi:hypothetical protein
MKYFTHILAFVFLFIACDKDEDNELPTEADPAIAFSINGTSVNSLSRSELISQLSTDTINLYDWVHGKRKDYRAFALEDVLETAFGSTAYLQAIFEDKKFVFSALDGFTDTATVAQIFTQTGYIALEDLNVNGINNWELVAQENNNNPYPFYVVWSDSATQNSTLDGYPWPYQLSNIDIGN